MKDVFTFAICAYKNSPYLEEAVLSAKRQSTNVNILIATSTPSEYIKNIATKHNIAYFINPEQKGIASDWEFAVSCARTPLVTIMHQDDVYLPNYAENIITSIKNNPDTLIAFTDYGDLLSDGECKSNRFYLFIKRFLLFPFYLKNYQKNYFTKHISLVFGNSICCPSVCYNVQKLKKVNFDRTYSVNLDWAKWLELAKKEGGFMYIPKILMMHRIDPLMETSSAITDNRRYNEDYRIFSQIWFKPIAKILLYFYKFTYKYNCDK